jgi:hypothetical protein
VNNKRTPVVPNAVALTQALESSATLSLLRNRIRDSDARLAAIAVVLPVAIQPHVKAGPVDEEGWTLLVANASVAAKIRQLQPRLEECLRYQGWYASSIRIKIQSMR